MRLLACLLLVLALAVPARALDDEGQGHRPGRRRRALRAIDEGNMRDADHPEAAGEEVEAPDEHDAIDAEQPAAPTRTTTGRRRPRRPRAATPRGRRRRSPRATPNVLESAAPTGQATGGKRTDGKGAAPKAPSPVDADD